MKVKHIAIALVFIIPTIGLYLKGIDLKNIPIAAVIIISIAIILCFVMSRVCIEKWNKKIF